VRACVHDGEGQGGVQFQLPDDPITSIDKRSTPHGRIIIEITFLQLHKMHCFLWKNYMRNGLVCQSNLAITIGHRRLMVS